MTEEEKDKLVSDTLDKFLPKLYEEGMRRLGICIHCGYIAYYINEYRHYDGCKAVTR